ncbi:MAG: DNA/RNA nuclease SfsA [Clostridia bacterium]|nr:DNA/RNA nuclease SfsA [Clostridia bacterium]
MTYPHVVQGVFLSRPNRFIAHCLINGKMEICHVKNTGRCKELLVPNATVYLQDCLSPARKTRYDLIAVEKNGILFNMDSQAPNKAVAEWLPKFLGENAVIRPEYSFGESRMDFFATVGNRKILMEVKGVTLERNAVALFPDAPTLRGVKHLRELTKAVDLGYECYVMFVIQAEGVTCFTPNRATDPAFAEALVKADEAGVKILAYDCAVTPSSMTIQNPVLIQL